MKTIDYYDYWNAKRAKNEKLKYREISSIKIIKKLVREGGYILDAGCGNGNFIIALQKSIPHIKTMGVDYSATEVQEGEKSGLDVRRMDLGRKLKLNDNSFDIVYAGEIIEHLYNPDLFLSEINRVLKMNGHLVLTTPNLCAWFNRILMLFGVQPLFLEPSTKSKMVGSGFLKKFKKESNPVGHIRIFTLAALKDLLKMNGFKLLGVKGNAYEEGFPKKLLFADRLAAKISPKLAGQFVLVAMKNAPVNTHGLHNNKS